MSAYKEGQWIWVCNWKYDPDGSGGDDGGQEPPRIAAHVSGTPTNDKVVAAPVWGDVCWKCEKLDRYAKDSQPATIELDPSGLSKGLPYPQAMDITNIEGRQDMVDLADLQVGELMHNLRLYYKATPMKIYTYVGDILIVMNPMQNIGLIDEEHQHMYHDRPLGDPEIEPHIYAIGDEAYRMMVDHGCSQSIVISGESGAGKSESTKHVLGYVAHCSAKAGAKTNVNEQILATSEVLEAFGNAKTKRNHNSSRFGKFVEIQFDAKGGILGARIEQYLLEKSRVTAQETTERNYHIFYMLITCLEPAEKAQLHLGEVKDYVYLIGPGGSNKDSWPFRPDGVTDLGDKEKFPEVVENMNKLNLDKGFQMELWRLMAGVLNIGQIQFGPPGSDGMVTIKNPESVSAVADLLGLDEAALLLALQQRHVIGTTYAQFNEKQARDNADGLAKAIYGNTFVSLVEDKINSAIRAENEAFWIGVLDIFGFESFQEERKQKKGKRWDKWIDTVNKFEQLCINVTNEQLQNFFYDQLIPKQLEKYKAENIQVANIYFADNTPCLNMIKRSKTSLFRLLDGVTKLSKTNRDMQADMSVADKKWLVDIKSNYKNGDKTRQVPQSARRSKEEEFLGWIERDLKHSKDETDFCVFHYAGVVWYTVDGAVERNKDAVSKDVNDVLTASSFQWLSEMFPPLDEDAKTASTVAKKFSQQLDELQANLETTEPFFVRCVKPNCIMQKGGFLEDHKVLEQLICAGMYAIIEMRQNGYPVERPAGSIVEGFDVIEDDKEMFNALPSDDARAAHICDTVMAMYPEEVENKDGMPPYQIGRTKVFIKDEMFKAMNKAKAKAVAELRLKQAGSIEVLKAVIRMAVELRALPEREETAARNAVKFARKKELMAQGMSESDALAQIEAEHAAELARIEAEYKAAHYDVYADAVPSALSPVDSLVSNIDIFMGNPDAKARAADPDFGDNGAQMKNLQARRKTLVDLKSQLSTVWGAYGASAEAYHNEETEAKIKELIEALDVAEAAEATAMAKDEDELKTWVNKREQWKREEAERKAKEEAERKERERLAEIQRRKEEAERKEREKRAAIEAEKRRRLEIREAKRKAKNDKRNQIIAERDRKLQEEQKAAEEERIRLKTEAKRQEKAKKLKERRMRKLESSLHSRCLAVIGTKVKFEDMLCTVQYFGVLPYAGSSEFVGIECPKANGEMNDGAVGGIQLFHCAPNHGKFVRADMLQIVETSVTSYRRGQRVWIRGTHRMGEVMWTGTADFKGVPASWVGVKLDKPFSGKNDGSVNGIRYFDAPNQTGIFAPPHKLHLIHPWTEDWVQDTVDRYVVLHCLEEDDSEDDLDESDIEDTLFGADDLDATGDPAASSAAAPGGGGGAGMTVSFGY